jgi:hypothetical protein
MYSARCFAHRSCWTQLEDNTNQAATVTHTRIVLMVQPVDVIVRRDDPATVNRPNVTDPAVTANMVFPLSVATADLVYITSMLGCDVRRSGSLFVPFSKDPVNGAEIR